uniref:Sugar transporter ERD6-like 9 n=2 Tax=Hirondellea gigas TaxID=1518452 RepID=A0A6A7G222_9CRUS
MMVWLGQRKTMLVALPLVMITWVALAFASSVGVLLTLRFMQGVLVGVVIGPAVSYIVEVSHHSIRGSMTGIIDIVRQVGYVLVFSVGSCGMSWRYTALICGLTTTVLPFLALFFYPDSPRWLVIHNKIDEAYKAIRFFHGDQYDVYLQFDTIYCNISKNNHGQNTTS